jgi:cell division protein YceG involved in septum cleavage
MFSFLPIYKKKNSVKINVLIYFFQFTINVLVKKYEKGSPSKTKNKASSNASIEVQQGNQVSQIGSIKRYWHSSKQSKMNNILQL